jgi:hypothetical protein
MYDVEERPILASWMKSTHPDQIRLTAYLERLIARLSPLPTGAQPLFLHMEIAVSDQRRVLTHHDLENYLNPLFGSRWLDSSKFVLVSATKRVGGASRISIGFAEGPEQEDLAGWNHFSKRLDAGLNTNRKTMLRDELAVSAQELPPGPVEVRLGWRCSSRRNWTSLWKPTGDCMGPVLGTTRSIGFNPRDDRIVSLAHHREVDDALKNALDVGMWWRPHCAA